MGWITRYTTVASLKRHGDLSESFLYASFSLQWRHNEQDSVSNHQPHNCLLNCLFRPGSNKTSKLRVTGLCAGNSPGTGEFPAQMASNAENVSIWWRHHVRHEQNGRRFADDILKCISVQDLFGILTPMSEVHIPWECVSTFQVNGLAASRRQMFHKVWIIGGLGIISCSVCGAKVIEKGRQQWRHKKSDTLGKVRPWFDVLLNATPQTLWQRNLEAYQIYLKVCDRSRGHIFRPLWTPKRTEIDLNLGFWPFYKKFLLCDHAIGLQAYQRYFQVCSISQEICTRFLLCCALLWLYIDWFSHIHQAYFTGTVAI